MNPKRQRVEGGPRAGVSGYRAQHSDQGPAFAFDRPHAKESQILGLSAEETATDYALRYGRSDVRAWETYLTEAGDASDVLAALADVTAVKRRYRMAVRGQLLRVRPGQIVRLYPTQGGLADRSGVTSPVDVRVISREIDYDNQIVTATAVEV